jgi:peptidoglycan/xylan/chitin deacetylase (PgdA/CDA1 family)
MRSWKDYSKSFIRPITKSIISNKVRILFCHRFGKQGEQGKLGIDLFKKQCEYMKKNFNIISLSDYAHRLQEQIALPRNSLIITVDDGYSDIYSHAFPIFKEFEIPATVFLATGFLNNEFWFWWDQMRYIFFKTSVPEYVFEMKGDKKNFKLNTIVEREFAWDYVTTECLYLALQNRNQILSQMEIDLAVNIPSEPNGDFRPLTWDEVIEMKNNGIEFGSHSHTHPILSIISSDQKKEEVEKSKQILENKFQEEVTLFTYPNGQKKDYDDETIRFVQEAGYRCAPVGYRGLNDLTTNPYEVKRLDLNDNFEDLMNKINGVEYVSDKIKSLIS